MALDFLIALLIKGAGAVLSIFLYMKIASLYGSEGVGEYAFVVQLCMLVGLVLKFGGDNIIIRTGSSLIESEEIDKFSSLVKENIKFVMRTFSFALIFFIVAAIISHLLNQKINYLFLWVAVISPLIAIFGVVSAALIAAGSLKLALFLQSVFVSSVGLGFILSPLFNRFSWLPLLSYFLANSVAIFICILSNKLKLASKNDALKTMGVKKERMQFFLISMADLIIFNMDIIILGFFTSTDLLGFYAVATRLTIVGALYGQAIDSYLSPRFAKFYVKGDVGSMRKTYLKFTALSSLGAICFVALTILFSSNILNFFGSEFSKSIFFLQVLCGLQSISICTATTVPLLLMCKQEKFLRNIQVFVASIYVLLLIILVPKYGATGCLISMAIAPISSKFFLFFYVEYLFKTKWLGPNNLLKAMYEGD